MSDAETWTRRGFAPAHATGFFVAETRHTDPYRRGSRGAGINLELGVHATVAVEEGEEGFRVRIDGGQDDAPTVLTMLEGIVGAEYPARVTVDLHADLPYAQGFGISGAGALAAALALADLFGIPPRKAMWEAHKAEVLNQTGLGDVPAQYLGGAEIRVTPGPMPMGVIQRFSGLQARRVHVVTCVLDEPLATRSVLRDAARMELINAAGAQCVEALLAAPTLENYARLARGFAERSGLITPRLQEALTVADGFGWATQTMLGNSLHLIIDPRAEGHGVAEDAAAALQAHGQVAVTRISAQGAHAVKPEPAG